MKTPTYPKQITRKIRVKEIEAAKQRSAKRWRFEFEIETLCLLMKHYNIPIEAENSWFRLSLALANDHISRLRTLEKPVGRPRKIDGFLEALARKRKRGQPIKHTDYDYITMVQEVSAYKAKLKQAGQKATDKAAIEEIFRDRVREQGKNFSSIKYADDISAYQKLLPRARKRIAEIIINY